MSHPTTRLLTILELLHTYEQMSGAEIARRLEVAPRTIRRYITSLQDIGIPIETQRGRYGAYRTGLGGTFRAFGIQVVTLDDCAAGLLIADVTTFLDPSLLPFFGFPPVLPR